MSASDPRGFAGLATLVSDITADIADAERLARLPRAGPAPAAAPTPAVPVVRAPLAGLSSGVKWALGLAAVFFVFWLIGSLTNHASPPQSEPTSTTQPSPGEPTPLPVPQAPPAPPPNFDVPEEKPPTGTNLSLNAGQIRYCLAEAIRIDAVRTVIDNQRPTVTDVDRFNRGVRRFNAWITDWNSRCSRYMYDPETFAGVKDVVEAQRATIEHSAREQWQAEQ